MNYKIIGKYWYTPPFPGLDPAAHVILGMPNVGICVVAIASGPKKDNWKAYIGYVPYGDDDAEAINHAEQLVARNGAKVEKSVACAYFPRLDPERFVF